MANSNTYIKSRKHDCASRSPAASLIAAAAALATLGLPVLAQTTPAGASSAPSLKEVNVEGSRSTGYEPAQVSSPKFTQAAAGGAGFGPTADAVVAAPADRQCRRGHWRIRSLRCIGRPGAEAG
jgi:hypothetical protein